MQAALAAATGLEFRAAPSSLGAGGGFAACQRWESTAGPVFVKVAPLAREAALEAEAAALRELAAASAVRVPEAAEQSGHREIGFAIAVVRGRVEDHRRTRGIGRPVAAPEIPVQQ